MSGRSARRSAREWRRRLRVSRDEDAAYLHRLGAALPPPVFVMGLHRSGTTFLYESLARVFALAPLTAYHIVFYRRLLSGREQGSDRGDRALLGEYFEAHGMQTRQIDEIALGPDAAEEYGWLLRRHGPSVHLEARTLELFGEMCRKLLYLRPDCRAVVMKNPWDAGRAPEIHALLPGSRFVFIERDPLRVLDSRLRNEVRFSSGPSPYLDLLTRGFPFARAVFAAQRTAYRLLGAARFRRLMARLLARNVVRELEAQRSGFARLAPELRLRLSYAELSSEPGRCLARVGDFLGLAPRPGAEALAGRPRHGALAPEVEALRADFERELERRGLRGGGR